MAPVTTASSGGSWPGDRRALRHVPAIVALVVAGAACSGVGQQDTEAEPRASAPATVTTHSPTPSPSPTPTPTPPTTEGPPPDPTFEATIAAIDEAGRTRLTHSWRPGCPVPLEDLRLITLDHWDSDGTEQQGELVVHADEAEAIVEVFGRLFEARFPIDRMQLVDVYGGDDHASTLDNNTAAFNCRWVVGKPGAWSEHAFGRAIDVNPRVNPYVVDPRVDHPELAPYLDRSLRAPGMINGGSVAIEAFAAVGWHWGGTWSSPDYQHFSATGR